MASQKGLWLWGGLLLQQLARWDNPHPWTQSRAHQPPSRVRPSYRCGKNRQITTEFGSETWIFRYFSDTSLQKHPKVPWGSLPPGAFFCSPGPRAAKASRTSSVVAFSAAETTDPPDPMALIGAQPSGKLAKGWQGQPMSRRLCHSVLCHGVSTCFNSISIRKNSGSIDVKLWYLKGFDIFDPHHILAPCIVVIYQQLLQLGSSPRVRLRAQQERCPRCGCRCPESGKRQSCFPSTGSLQ